MAIVIRLLRILYDLNLRLAEYSVNDEHFNHIATSKFTNSKLTAKLNKQLGDLLIVVSNIMPAWVIDGCRSYPFLFPFETRLQFCSQHRSVTGDHFISYNKTPAIKTEMARGSSLG